MNNVNNMMMRRDGTGVPETVRQGLSSGEQNIVQAGNANSAMMLRREDVIVPDIDGTDDPLQEAMFEEKAVPDIPDVPDVPVMNAGQAVQQQSVQKVADIAAKAQQAASAQVQKQVANQPNGQAGKPANAQQQAKAPPQPPKPMAAASVKHFKSPDELCQMYVQMFRSTLGLDLSMSICYENMRRICEVDVKDPAGTLYFLENTYRVSTILYLAGNLPILFVASVLAEKNRKNILKYVTIEVENGTKPYKDVLELRQKRWMRKYENMAVNDAMTVTPGATSLTLELVQKISAMVTNICGKLKKFNGEMSTLVSRFDDSARNDIVFIYSNWWYLLQGFENVPEMRAYIMSVTDDTRKNLKI